MISYLQLKRTLQQSGVITLTPAIAHRLDHQLTRLLMAGLIHARFQNRPDGDPYIDRVTLRDRTPDNAPDSVDIVALCDQCGEYKDNVWHDDHICEDCHQGNQPLPKKETVQVSFWRTGARAGLFSQKAYPVLSRTDAYVTIELMPGKPKTVSVSQVRAA